MKRKKSRPGIAIGSRIQFPLTITVTLCIPSEQNTIGRFCLFVIVLSFFTVCAHERLHMCMCVCV